MRSLEKFAFNISGQGLLALVILIGGIILAVGATLALVTISYVDSSYGYAAVQQAEAIATAGAEDALLQLARDNIFASPSGYTFTVGSSTANVQVTQSSPSSGFVTILSTATVSLRTRKIQVVLSQNQTTGQETVVSWGDVQ